MLFIYTDISFGWSDFEQKGSKTDKDAQAYKHMHPHTDI